MHAAEKALAKACQKVAKWYPDKVRFQKLPSGFLLTVHGDSEFAPTIGVVEQQLVGALDSYDVILDILGYECQIERVLFDPDRVRFVLDAGWSGKYWLKPTPKQIAAQADFSVDTIGSRMPAKISAEAVILMAVVQKESLRRPVRAVKAIMKRSKTVLSGISKKEEVSGKKTA